MVGDKASVYFYRDPIVELLSSSPTYSSGVYVQRERIGELEPGGYFVHYLQPDRYHISNASTEDYGRKPIWLTVEAGRSYFIKMDYRIRQEFFLQKGPDQEIYLKSVDAQEAMGELKRCRLMVISK